MIRKLENADAALPVLAPHDGPLARDLVLEPGRFGLGQVPAKVAPDAVTTLVCGYCSTGCGLDLHLREGRTVNLTPRTEYPVNLGMACPKGWEALTVLKADDRAVVPLVRDAKGRQMPTDWHSALTLFCDRFRDIQTRHGPQSTAFLSTGQIPTEEMALLGAVAKFGMGMLHGDGNTRQCMATSVVAYKQAFGFDAPPYTYADFEQSDVIVLIGSNLCIAHPILWQRIGRNPHQPKIIVVDPRRTETAMAATTHLPLRPKSDLVLLYGIAHVLIREGWIDRAFIEAHTTGFADFAAHVAAYTPERTAAETGLDARRIVETAATIHAGRRVSFWWTMGVNQSYEGVRTAQAIINLALMTGNIGRPGTGANSITGQCNAMGSRMFSNTTALYAGRDFANAEHRREVADILQVEEERIPREPSWAYDQIVEGILAGKIRGLWVVATNPAHSWINQNTLHDILDRLDFLVVQDMYHSTETARRAHLVLPAAAWGEKDGTFINSERRLGVVKKVSQAPGQALADFSIFRLVGEYWGCGDWLKRWNSPAAAFELLKQLSRGRPCDITGIADYRMLDERGGIQWPFPSSSVSAETDAASAEQNEPERRLFADGRFYTPDGRAKFLFAEPTPMPETPTAEYPLLLLTGRGTAAQWHTQTRTAKSPVLRKLYPAEPYVELNPQDARALGLQSYRPVMVESQRGRVRARALVTPTVQPGQAFMAMHYDAVNRLTFAHFDPYSRQPSYKNCAVRVRPLVSGD